jgi:hypothetical protein
MSSGREARRVQDALVITKKSGRIERYGRFAVLRGR